MRLTKWIFFGYLTAIVLIVAGIGFSFTVEPTRDPGRLYTAFVVNLKSLDPAICNDVDGAAIIGNVYECLYNYKYGVKPYELFPQLAADMPEVSEDGRTYTVKLRKGIHFYDPWKKAFEEGKGPEMKASDVVFTFKRVADFHLASPNFSTLFQGKIAGIDEWNTYTEQMSNAGRTPDYAKPVEGIKAIDDYTVQIKLVEKSPQFRYLLAYLGAAVVSQKAVEVYGDDFRTRPVGTGPFVMTEYLAEQRIVFEANPVYRGRPDVDGYAKVADADRLPKLKSMQYDYFNEPMPIWYFLQHGTFDMGRIPKETFGQAIDPKTGKLRAEMVAKGFDLDIDEDPSIYYYGFNMGDPVLGKNRPLRQAMSLAFDREKYIRVYENGRGVAANGPIPPTFDVYDADAVDKYSTFDLEAARAKLKEAEQINGGVIPELSLLMGDTSTDVRQQAEYFVSQMRQIGLRIRPEYNTWARFQELVDGRKTQIFSLGWVPDYPDEQTFFQLFYGKFAPPQGINSCAYVNPDYDKIYNEAMQMDRSPERAKLYKQLVAIVNEDCPWIYTHYPKTYMLRWNWLKPFPVMDYGSGFRQYLSADLDKRKQMLHRK